ncbi:MAG TPA: alginate lyase family protein [Pyrinomonadaceae bacterium]|jgi:hypothetical protein
MAGTLKKLKKLRGRSLDELKVRGAQALSVYAERAGSARRVPEDAEFFSLFEASRVGGASLSAESLLEHFRTRTSPRFFPSFANRSETVEEWRRRFGVEALGALVERAERITRGRFQLLGLPDISFGEPIDWHFEPRSNRRAPHLHWSRIDYLDPSVAGDKKIIWELNRQQYFMVLGRAYWLTGDERYAETFAAHLDAWMDSNPPKLGINWASSLEVAFRSISWLWALHFFKHSTHLSPQLFLRALKFLYLHARHLETYPSTYFSPNTHLTGEALGLFYLGTLLADLRAAARWRASGKKILLEQLPRHVRPDGVYFEQSSYYHRYTTDFYTHLFILARENGEQLGDEVQLKLKCLLDHLMHLTRPDGTTPFFGDDDGGRLSMLEERAPDDFRAALSNGAALFTRGDYKFVAGSALAEETLWLTGTQGARAFDQLEARPPSEPSRAFRAGGFYTMRDGWTSDASYLLIDSGAHGDGASAAHAHADALSFNFAARGRTLIVDSGTYTYTGDAALRDYFRSSQAHNTLVIDGESSSVPGGAFAWASAARSSARRWTTCERFSYFEGSHDGYERFPPPQKATHTRKVLFLRDDYVVLHDRVEAEGEHAYELYFHLAPGAELSLESGTGENAEAVRVGGSPGLTLQTFGANGLAGDWRTEQAWVSRAYAERSLAPVAIYSASGRGEQEFYTFLIPEGDAQRKRARVGEVEATCGHAFTIELGTSDDLLLLKAPASRETAGARVQTTECTTDSEWAWLRFASGSDDESAPAEWILLDGSYLVFRRREIFRAKGRVGYASARRVGERLLVETDARAGFTVDAGGARRVVVGGQEFEIGAASSVEFKVGAGGAFELAEVRLDTGVASRGSDLSEGAREEIYVRD